MRLNTAVLFSNEATEQKKNMEGGEEYRERERKRVRDNDREYLTLLE